MQWELALKKIEQNPDFEKQKPIVELLHQEINDGNIHDSRFLSGLDALYRSQNHPGLLSEIKRMQNRFKIRNLLGKDLLRMTSPPLGDKEKKKMWEQIHGLKSVYNETTRKPDQDFESRYQVLNKIGGGGMSVVFKGVRIADNKEVAIKFLKEEYFSSPVICERFNRECKMSISFDHPSIAKVFEIDKGENTGYMIMEYLPKGGTDSILSDPELDFKMALSIVKQAARALSYIHEKKVVHRDIKLSNLLIKTWEPGKKIQIKLTDFGISKEVNKEGLTVIGTKMGTDFYCAPEQRESPEKVDHRADIYSLGVCLYRLISKKGYPEGDFPAINKICSQAPVELNDIVMRCLKNNPDNRFSSADELLSKLEKL
ncbi:MAG: serine/threonine protein kinase [Desulfobacula sp.]|nr:serine/threonine protein kinase [Desulfobacula sp.]